MSEEHGFVVPVRSFIEGSIDFNTTMFTNRAERRAEQPVTSAPPAEMDEDLHAIVARKLAAKGAHHTSKPTGGESTKFITSWIQSTFQSNRSLKKRALLLDRGNAAVSLDEIRSVTCH
jgi:hypothetical protein